MLWVGIDVHKKTLQVCVYEKGDNPILERRIANDRESVISLCNWLDGRGSIALEASQNWWMLYEEFVSLGLDVHVCHSRLARLIAESSVSNDKHDARRLALLLRSGFLPECYVPSGDCRELRELVRARASARKTATSIKNQIHAILGANWVKHCYSDLFGKAGREFVRSVEIRDGYKLVILSKLELLEDVESQLRRLDSEIVRRAQVDLRATLLTTIPGVAEFTALLILGEIGEISRFPRAQSLVNFAGLHPGEDSSGDRIRRRGITKEGCRWLRWILVEAAHHAVRKEGKIRDLYLRVEHKRGRNRAIVAAARELLVSIYWMLNRLEPYRPEGSRRSQVLAGEAR